MYDNGRDRRVELNCCAAFCLFSVSNAVYVSCSNNYTVIKVKNEIQNVVFHSLLYSVLWGCFTGYFIPLLMRNVEC